MTEAINNLRVTLCASSERLLEKLGKMLAGPRFDVYAVQSFSVALKGLRRHRIPLVIADQIMQGGYSYDLFTKLGPPRHGQIRLLLHRFGDPIPSRSLHNSLVYHDIIPYPLPSTDFIESIEAWLQSPNTVPDLRTLNGKEGTRQRTPPADPDLAPPPQPLETIPLAQALTLNRRNHSIEDFLKELNWRSQQAPEANYWTLLGLKRGAGLKELTMAFDQASLRFHPDRNHSLPASAKRSLRFLYALLCEAYDVLSSNELTARYIKNLDSGKIRLEPSQQIPHKLDELTSSGAARRFIKLANAAIKEGDYQSARQNLQFAISLDQNNQDLVDRIDELTRSFPKT